MKENNTQTSSQTKKKTIENTKFEMYRKPSARKNQSVGIYQSKNFIKKRLRSSVTFVLKSNHKLKENKKSKDFLTKTRSDNNEQTFRK